MNVKWKYNTDNGDSKTAYAPTSCPIEAADYNRRTTGDEPTWMVNGQQEFDMLHTASEIYFGKSEM